MIDEILTKLNLKYENLSKEEQDTLNTWINSLQQGALTVDKIREYIRSMKEQVEQDLSTSPTNLFMHLFGWRRDYLLKARLRNYMLLLAFLESPEKAKKSMERALASLVSKK